MTRDLVFTLSLLGLFAAANVAQAQMDYNFHRLTVDDGLTHNTVYALHQDRYGYMWIGTGRGLHRYSGSSLKTFQHDRNDPNSLGPGFVRSIFEDSRGRIWVGTEGGGVSIYKGDTFERYSADGKEGSLSHGFVEDIIELPDGTICLATWGGGINFFRDETFTHLRHDPADSASLPTDDIVEILYDPETQTLWAGTWDKGLCAIKDGVVTQYIESPEGFDSKQARTLAQTRDGAIWIGTWGDGLYRMKDNRFEHFDLGKGRDNPVEENKILSLSAAPDGGLWIGSFGGGVKYYDGKNFRRFYSIPDRENSLSSNYIETTFVDREGDLWVGTYGAGATKFDETYFHAYRHDPGNSSSISSNYVRNIVELQNGDLWIGNRGKGIDVFDGKEFRPLNEVHGGAIDGIPVYTIAQRRNGDIWLGAVSGAGLFECSDGKVTEVSTKYGIDFKEYHLNFLKESSDGAMWVFGSYGLGVVRIKEDSVVQFLHDPADPNSLGTNTVLCMAEGRDGTIWLGTRRKGLNAYKDGKFTRYESVPDDPETLSNDFVFAIHEAKNGTLWVGTEKGLNKLDPKTGKFKRYFKEDGLVDDYIASMVTDTDDNLWLGTHGGLVKIDPTSDEIWNFDMRDGVEVYPFNFNAAHRGRTSGQLFFGGVGGFLAFHPDSIKRYSSSPRLQITDLSISKAELSAEDQSILKERIEETTRLTLRRGFEKLSFEFSDMEFDFGDRNQFSYLLEGFDSDWNNLGQDNSASYTNLPAGNYVLNVRSSPDGLQWSQPITLDIQILPLWWETFWVKTAVVGIGFFALVVLFRWRNRFLIRRSRGLEMTVAEKTREVEARNKEITEQNEQLTKVIKDLRLTQQQLIESEKMASLGILSAGIGHEINNPLNFIKGGVEGLKLVVRDESDVETLKKDISNLISIMQDGVDRTARIVRSLSHFSRDNERWNERCNIQLVLENCLIMLSNQLWEKVTVHKDVPEEPVFVIGNEGKLHQAFLNILTNAIQSIHDQGEITITVSQTESEVSVKISDTGCGIPEENLMRINDPFFTTKEPGKGTGMGLFITYDIISQHRGQLHCESVVGQGSSFNMTFPVEDLVEEETFVR